MVAFQQVNATPQNGDREMQAIQNAAQQYSDAIARDPSSALKMPMAGTAARSFIRVGGRAIGIANSFRWNILHKATTIQTVDSQAPWDIDVGASVINAEMGTFSDPTGSLEALGVFQIIQAAIHQPMVEIQVVDRSVGSMMFFSRGMFVSMSGDQRVGNLSQHTARFIGITYQGNVGQQFRPYAQVTRSTSNLVNGLSSIVSSVTGGII